MESISPETFLTLLQYGAHGCENITMHGIRQNSEISSNTHGLSNRQQPLFATALETPSLPHLHAQAWDKVTAVRMGQGRGLGSSRLV